MIEMPNLTTLLLKIPRNVEVTPEAAKTFLSALTQVNSIGFWQKLTGGSARPLALEIASINQQIQFLITCDSEIAPYIEAQLQSNYPLVVIQKVADPLVDKKIEVKELKLSRGNYYPVGTYDKFADVDPLSSILSVLSKAEPTDIVMVQVALQSTSSSWQSKGAVYSDMGTKNEDGSYSPRPDKTVITEKINYPGFNVSLRLIANTNKALGELKSAFGVFARSDGNSFSSASTIFKFGSHVKNAQNRKVTGNYILNVMELATIWHLPSEKIKTEGIAWGTKVLSEPPENLPSAITASDEDKKHINFFGKTIFKNRDTIFGIKDIDRRRHIWVIGKTGTGKSTVLANMAIDDLKKDRGLAIIDPHGDTSDIILNYIPKHRINDVIYFNPADKDYPIVINPLEVTNKEEAELVVSGIVSIFNKIFGFSWGPRLEYILRNSLSTLAQIPNSTLKDVPLLLTNKAFRTKIENELQDPVMAHFWRDEFDKMTDKLQQEAISPILNKVGQFVASPLIRSVIGQPKSSISLDDIMNDGKILIANLSQGRLGEDNAALLGAMLITKFQLAAMHRVSLPEEERKDFYLYVDEFQNFATGSFIKIMSEARKYRLDITLANQYMAQIPEEVTKAILGNAGTVMTFAVGAGDADILTKEFAEVFTAQDLINLGKYQIAAKMTIDGQITRPFVATTLPLPISSNMNKEKVIQMSRSRWTRKLSHDPPPSIR
ncbi:MAG TPA: type IV secretion system DNA-binding domain-containing protein [Patescibacteria group bacterium]|nr:type IV secretion system DNA-binding domain-containing protein [Patescibacteria group bacterium]